MTAKYLKPGSGYDIFGAIKPNQRRARLLETAKDLYALIQLFSGDSRVQGMETFKRVLKVFKDQRDLVVPEGGLEPAVELKDPSEISPDSLQNPSDPDAGYSGHKGKGRQVQIA
jgi:hypothetical protein